MLPHSPPPSPSSPTTNLQQPAAALGGAATVDDFRGPRVSVSRTDGAIAVYSVSPYPLILERLCAGGSWEKAIRLCRYAKRRELWACLAGAFDSHEPIFSPYATHPCFLHITGCISMPRSDGREWQGDLHGGGGVRGD